MLRDPKVGETAEISFLVETAHAIDFAEDGMPAVLSTPWLIWFLEHAARAVMLPILDVGESTVGVQVDVQHLAATPVGHQVTCRARVINREGTLVSFQLEAHDEHELISRAVHKLQVIDVQRFAKRVERKLSR